mmetsp:Transcript_2868/g.4119  ORF Transcript_2868/g.4119 Transcript_2868/m.4119 type:complete len:651 (-) Transcript_2868:382-2334(-)|eukprot:CAMPEP_0203762108 /NCGR_PEP_ID=MMETSP0098-20131031/15064_1 /ASSEMBLY_ACC=CAM_ASM_000208 /TAXON_ID=96639 /ORGANISM=" , Strain NY0313808BC1" /LENGTH=650 /DNA_ID=CAMNT_0050656385 /DNA_START=213 /DNA_END=2165 /DNA_ORIENTATION=-
MGSQGDGFADQSVGLAFDSEVNEGSNSSSARLNDGYALEGESKVSEEYAQFKERLKKQRRLRNGSLNPTAQGMRRPLTARYSEGAGYSRLYDGIEFDRGSKWERFQRWVTKRWSRWWDRLLWMCIASVRSCGFMVDGVDAIRATQRGSADRAEEDPGDLSPESIVLRHNVKLGVACICLVFATALEPILLKVMTDHAKIDDQRDYRYVLAQLLILSHVPLALGSLLFYAWQHSRTTLESCDFPKTWFVILAFLNSLHMLLLVVPCGSVPAPLTILLPHAGVPFTLVVAAIASLMSYLLDVFFPEVPDLPGQSTGPEREYFVVNGGRPTSIRKALKAFFCTQPQGLISIIFICAGIAVGLYPILTKNIDALGLHSYCFNEPDCASSTVLFLFAALPASLSVICEERALVRYAIPVSPIVLHGWLIPMQFLFGALLAPVGRHLQHPSRMWGNVSVELKGISDEVSDGLRCILLGEESGIGLIGTDPTWCEPLLPSLILFLLVSFAFHVLTLFVMRRGTEICLRICTGIAIPIGWGVLVFYDVNFHRQGAGEPTQVVISPFSKIAMVCVVIGVFFHKTVVEPEPNFILTSPFEERDRLYIETIAERHRRTLMDQKSRSIITNMQRGRLGSTTSAPKDNEENEDNLEGGQGSIA